MYYRYSGIIVEVKVLGEGYTFFCQECDEWQPEVRGDISACENRIYQHFHHEHGYDGTATPMEDPPETPTTNA